MNYEQLKYLVLVPLLILPAYTYKLDAAWFGHDSYDECIQESMKGISSDIADTKQIEFKLLEFEKIVYENSVFSFYDGGLEYIEKKDSLIDQNINCLIDQDTPTSNTIDNQPEFEKVVYKRSIGDSNNKAFLDIDLEFLE